MYDIDSTGAQTFVELLDELNAREITLSMARVRTEIRDELYEGAIEQRIGADRIYLEIDDGVTAFLQRDTDPQTD
jgi:hypothetical protein